MPRGPRPGVRRQHGSDITLDDILLIALEDGPVTVRDITKRVERRLRIKLDKLRVRGLVLRKGRGGTYREFTYELVQRELAATALREKGGCSHAEKATPQRRPQQGDPLQSRSSQSEPRRIERKRGDPDRRGP
jgi:hypothetical protein